MNILDKLPLVAAEGLEYTEAAFSDLLEPLIGDPHKEASLIYYSGGFSQGGRSRSRSAG